MIEVAGPPSRWVVRAGRPADVVWVDHQGIPSYETDDGSFVVYDLLVASETCVAVARPGVAAVSRTTMFFPRAYSMVAVRSVLVGDHELCALRDDPDASWIWRPLIYEIGAGLTRRGSQEELEWRWSLQQMDEVRQQIDERLMLFVLEQTRDLRRRYGCVPALNKEPGRKRLGKNARKRLYREYVEEVGRINRPPAQLPFQEANERAQAILLEHLNPQQVLDLHATGGFYVRGTINDLYSIRLGNGAAIVNPRTHHQMASLCLHPERWMPHADVALATKLAIESGPDGEQEMLAGARVRWFGPGPGPGATRADRAAWDRERDLLPPPLEVYR